jgi:hypothetical protein
VRWYGKLFYTQIPTDRKISVSNLPWVWIGAETLSGTIISSTELVNASIEYGDCITVQFLEMLTQEKNIKRWFYLDSKTFKEEEIPAEGLIIENDSDE